MVKITSFYRGWPPPPNQSRTMSTSLPTTIIILFNYYICRLPITAVNYCGFYVTKNGGKKVVIAAVNVKLPFVVRNPTIDPSYKPHRFYELCVSYFTLTYRIMHCCFSLLLECWSKPPFCFYNTLVKFGTSPSSQSPACPPPPFPACLHSPAHACWLCRLPRLSLVCVQVAV